MTINRIRVMAQTFAISLLLACISQRACPGDGGEPFSEPVVLFVTQDGTDGQADSGVNFASGFVVKFREDLFLVTATHCAQEFNDRTSVGIAGPLRSDWAKLAEITRLPDSGDRVDGRDNEVSIFRIIANHAPKPFLSEAQRIAIGSDELMTEIPRRGTELAIVGFPIVMEPAPAERLHKLPRFRLADDLQAIDASLLLTDNGAGAVTGVEVTTFVATREVRNPGGEAFNAAVFVAPPVHPQLAGSPVFVRRENGRNGCAGMYVGDIADVLAQSRISALVAARHITEEIVRVTEDKSM